MRRPWALLLVYALCPAPAPAQVRVAPAAQLSAIVAALVPAAPAAGPSPGTLAAAAAAPAPAAPLVLAPAEAEKLSILSRRLAALAPRADGNEARGTARVENGRALAPRADGDEARGTARVENGRALAPRAEGDEALGTAAPLEAWAPLKAELAGLSSRELSGLSDEAVHALAQRVIDRALGLAAAERGALEKGPEAASAEPSREAGLVQLGLSPSRPSPKPAAPAAEGPLARLEPNPSQLGVAGRFVVDGSAAGVEVTVPQAAGLAAAVARRFPPGTLKDGSLTRIVIVPGPGRVVVEEAGDYRQVVLPRDVLGERLEPKSPLPAAAFAAGAAARASPAPLLETPVRPRLREDASVFVGGLISVSAEPPEGFFAASSQVDFERRGRRATTAEEADAWIYRVPDARRESYFQFQYASPDRPKDMPRDSKFKIAVGIGPAHDPASPGGDEADLLWLGDEQHGGLDGLLRELERRDATLQDVLKHQGFALRLSPSSVVLSSLDKTHALTKAGFDALETDPARYRRVFSREYDSYLATLFEPPKGPKAKASYLLATSRGCSQGCAICCSGGLSQFQYFGEERMMQELRKLALDSRVGPGEVVDLFFVDSNFNNNPSRIVRFAELYAASELAGRFRFFVRHNTVNGFLLPEQDGVKRPNEALVQAYAKLGIREVFMGVDAYDDAGTLTLKTNRIQLARNGVAARPTYTYRELRELIRSFERAGLSAKGFFLTNNPWVSDLDRIDSYFNLLELWLENPHFSIDTREREILRLKPFPGSPITEVAERRGLAVVKDGRFKTSGPLGQLDELMDFHSLGRPRRQNGAERALREFRRSFGKIRRLAESAAADPSRPDADREAATQALKKILDRDRGLEPALAADEGFEGGALRAEIRAFRGRHASLGAFDEADQRRAFGAAASSLIEGLAEVTSSKPALRRGYPSSLPPLAGKRHTVKDPAAYLADNLSQEALAAARGPDAPFLIVVGDGRRAREAADAAGWKLLEPVEKREGFHRVFRARSPDGKAGYALARVNGEDRVFHVQSLLALAGLPPERLVTTGKTVSWKAEYLKTFKALGPPPDAVLYGFANTSVDSVLLTNKLRNARFFLALAAGYDLKRSALRDGEHDLGHFLVQELELSNGKRIWFLNCLYGDLAKDLLEAVVEHGARNVAFLGTAGALTPARRVSDLLTPAYRVREDGTREPLDWLQPVAGAEKAGGYLRVATPNVETEEWLEASAKAGADVTEVELAYALEVMRKHPEVRFTAGLVVSDVLAGAGRRDMTEWGLKDLRRLLGPLRKVLDGLLGQSGARAYRVKRYRWMPLAT